jgi:hypothetical protein
MTVSGGQVDHHGLVQGPRREQLAYVVGASLAAAHDHEAAARGLGQRDGLVKMGGRPGCGNDDGVQRWGGQRRGRQVSRSEELLMGVVLPDAR